MANEQKPRVLVVGAGSMGLIVGYHLNLGGADVTFLVRSHRAKDLDRPQLLYCYDDKQLKEFKDYAYVTDPSQMIGENYDYIFITVDGASLRSETGLSLVKTLREAVRGTETKVILGSVFVNLLSWFLQTSELPAQQVTNGLLVIHAFPTTATDLVEFSGQDVHLVEKADQAYVDRLGHGLVMDDSSPAVANGFAEIYNASGASLCLVKPAVEIALLVNPMFAVFAACTLLDWPKIKDVDTENELWRLGVAGYKEIQGLSIHGEAGRQAAAATNESAVSEGLAGLESMMLPFELQRFNRFHHGGKVNVQDRQHLRECIRLGEADGKAMTAVKDLLRRVESL